MSNANCTLVSHVNFTCFFRMISSKSPPLRYYENEKGMIILYIREVERDGEGERAREERKREETVSERERAEGEIGDREGK